jgi:hypothetical protein
MHLTKEIPFSFFETVEKYNVESPTNSEFKNRTIKKIIK